MNKQEKEYARELLSGLDENDLIELSKTVTKGLLRCPSNKQDAVELIIRYELDFKSLLNRKKITCKLLTQYLHYKGVQFNIEATKQNICEKLIEVLGCSPKIQGVDHLESIAGPTEVKNEESLSAVEPTYQVTVALSESDVNLLGVQFVDWFYSQVRGPDLELRSVEAQHFFSDASCRVLIGSKDVHEGKGSEGCANMMSAALRQAGCAIPIANTNSVRSQSSPHGAIKVLACGTLHARPARMLGSFEQAFLLVKDPSVADNWKIKYTELRLNAQPNGQEIKQPPPPSIQN